MVGLEVLVCFQISYILELNKQTKQYLLSVSGVEVLLLSPRDS